MKKTEKSGMKKYTTTDAEQIFKIFLFIKFKTQIKCIKKYITWQN